MNNAPRTPRPSTARSLLLATRPRQWLKNSFVVLPLVFSGNAGSPALIGLTFATFVIFCAASSATYLTNDIFDAVADREHPEKRNRPIASGALSRSTAGFAAVVLGLASLVGAVAINWQLLIVVLAYMAVTTAYSIWLKHLIILDIMAIATGFVLRVIGGAEAIDVRPSSWLIVCAGVLAMFLGFGKRHHELAALGHAAPSHRSVLAEYDRRFLDAMLIVTATLTIASYAIYTTSRPATPWLVATIPFVGYGVLRYLWLVMHEGSGGSPTEMAWTDRPIQLAVVLWILTAGLVLALS